MIADRWYKMAEDSTAPASERLLLIIKTTKDKIEVDVPSDYTVKQVCGTPYRRPAHSRVKLRAVVSSAVLPLCVQLKEHLSEKKGGLPVAQLCLIFAGRILKDEESLESQGNTPSPPPSPSPLSPLSPTLTGLYSLSLSRGEV